MDILQPISPINFNFNLRLNDPDHVSEFITRRMGPVIVEAQKGRQIEIATNATFVGHCTIFRSDIKSEMTVKPLLEEDFQSFILPTSGTITLISNGLQINGSPNWAIAVDGARAQQTLYSANHGHYCIVFPKYALTERLSIILDRKIPGHIQFEPVIDTNARKLTEVILLAELFTSKAEAESFTGSSLLARRLKELLLDLILIGWKHNFSSEFETKVSGAAPQHVTRAMDAINADPMAIYSVSDLAGISGVSVRALQNGFERHLGVRPVEHLRNVRLERARQDLLANPYEQISEVAKRWGFLNAGRFSDYFRVKFGMLPTQYRRKYRE